MIVELKLFKRYVQRMIAGMTCLLLLFGCSVLSPSHQTPDPAIYTLSWPEVSAGSTLNVNTSTKPAATLVSLTPINFIGIQAPDWLKQNKLIYSFDFDDPLRLRQYAYHRWSASLAQLLQQQIQHGLMVNFNVQVDASNVLKIEVIDFRQHFVSETSSFVYLSAWAFLQRPDGSVRKQFFEFRVDASKPNAPSAVVSMNEAGRQFTQSLVQWLLAQ